ncbi:MAG: O-antigen ligase family protein [Neisseria sp.]|nr:O-antigen ligase family protein [Neisseria sp.]
MLLAVILKLKPRLSALVYGIPAGAILAGGIALYQQFYLQRRPFTELMVIEASNIAMSLGLLSLCMIFYGIQKRMKWVVVLACLGLLGGVGASLLSGARGGWVLAPLLLVYIFYIYRESFDKKYIASFLAVLVAVAIGAISTAPVPVMNRLDLAIQNVEQYQAGNENTSVGLRFALWESALISIQEKPLIGWTKDGLKLSKQRQVEAGLAPPTILAFDHVHNQFLDDWAKYGLIGLVLLLVVFFAPMIALRKMRHLNHETQLLYTCLIVHVVAVMGFGLTQAFLNHNNGNAFYFLMTSIFVGYLAVQAQQAEIKHETDYS